MPEAKLTDEAIELACAHHAWETNRAFIIATGAGGQRAWDGVTDEAREPMLRLVKFVLAGGTAEVNWQLYREKETANGRTLPDWEKVPYTQRAKEELVVASIGAMAMALGHTKRPLEVRTVIARGQQPG